MKKIEIPQEENSAVDGKRKVMYAPNDNGKFETFKYGSAIEEYATKTAVEEFDLLTKNALENVKNKISSPIEYFMYLNRMDIPTLSSILGFFQFTVKKHIKAKNFTRLSDKILLKYSEAFNIDIKDLKEFNIER